MWRGRTNVDALTISCIEHAEAIVRVHAPAIAHQFVVTQGSYQGDAGDPDSAGTHALGGAVDLEWCGHPACYIALREAGMFMWHRTPEQGDWGHHFHGAPLDHPFMAAALARQQAAYLNRRNGLRSNGPDDGPRLDPIPRPVWPWPEENPVSPEEIKQIAAETAKQTVAQLLAAPVAKEGPTVKAALRAAAKTPQIRDNLTKLITSQVLAAIHAIPAGSLAAVEAETIEAAVKQALREGTED
jgi:hypothetical protein